MGLFDIFKKGKSDKELFFKNIIDKMFPNGEKDIDAGVKEFRYIFGNSVSYENAKRVFLKTTFLIFTAPNYTEEMLLSYFQREVNLDYNAKQIEKYFGYLSSLKVANAMHSAGAFEVHRNESGYYW